MNLSLPPQLKRFVEQKVQEGNYASVDEVVCDALRGLIEKDRLVGVIAHQSDSAPSNPYTQALATMTMEGSDIEAMVFIVLMQAAKDSESDLKLIMGEVKAMTAAKQKMRELIAKVQRDVATNAGQTDRKQPLDFHAGFGSQRAYHQAKMPFPDPLSEGGVKAIPTDLFRGEIKSICQLVAIHEELKGRLDSMSELSEMTSLRLQMVMDRRAKLMTTLSNLMKKISSTQEALVQNLK